MPYTTPRSTKVLKIEGTRLFLDGEPFFFQGLSFFNALYSPTFSQSAEERLSWLHKFKVSGWKSMVASTTSTSRGAARTADGKPIAVTSTRAKRIPKNLFVINHLPCLSIGLRIFSESNRAPATALFPSGPSTLSTFYCLLVQ